jgi:hypothetical protein
LPFECDLQRYTVEDEYRVNMILDNLPTAMVGYGARTAVVLNDAVDPALCA